jgi:hypothetical protein
MTEQARVKPDVLESKAILRRYLIKTALRIPLWVVAAWAVSRYSPSAGWVWNVVYVFVAIALLWSAVLYAMVRSAVAAERQELETRPPMNDGRDAPYASAMVSLSDLMPTTIAKLYTTGDSDGEAFYVPVVSEDVCEYTESPARFYISMSGDPVDLLSELVGCLGERFWLLIVLLYPRQDIPRGRYQSPPLTREEVRDFLQEFGPVLRSDSFLDFWIGDHDDNALIVYTGRGTLFLYGPLDRFAAVLASRGFTRGEVTLPTVQTRLFRESNTPAITHALARWDWEMSDLRPEDQ